MGPVAAIYDIHGNLPALEAVLEEIRREDVELIVVGGDVFPGPSPRETLDCLLRLDPPAEFIRGNGDRVVLEAMAGDEISVPEPYRAAIRWVAEELDPPVAKRIGAWPDTLRAEIRGLGTVLFCHATPRNDTEIFTRDTPEDRLLPIFEPLRADIVVCGHTHMQFDRMIGRTRVVNAGSVGMPFGEPGAYWLLLGPSVQLRRTTYDLALAGDRVRATHYPQASEFADNVLRPPPEADMLARFAAAALK